MKAITLWQPWATLIALGVKQWETRSWAPYFRGPLAIHAAKRKPQVDPANEHDLAILRALVDGGYRTVADAASDAVGNGLGDLPYGCVICVVDLVDVLHTQDAVKSSFFGPNEHHFGDYTPGRCAWRLANVRAVPNIPARGAQQLWEWNPPEGWQR